MQQGSAEWFQARCGKVTASRLGDIVVGKRGGYLKARTVYLGQLIAERLTGRVQENYCTQAMQWGIETEAQARNFYEFQRGVDVEEAGFVDHPSIANTGASPDGLVGADGGVEFKCPETHTHVDTLISGEIPRNYQLQMQWCMECTGRDWWDYVSFDPRMPLEHQMKVIRVARDEDLLKDLRQEVEVFDWLVTEKIKTLSKETEDA